MNKECPFCGEVVHSAEEEITHMLNSHLEVIQKRLRDAGMFDEAENLPTRPGVPGPHGGVYRLSEDSGIPITVTQPDDPAFALLQDDFTTKPKVYRKGCYICEDPEFALMGLPLCRPCPKCQEEGRGDGHVAADDTQCDDCAYDIMEDFEPPTAA